MDANATAHWCLSAIDLQRVCMCVFALTSPAFITTVDVTNQRTNEPTNPSNTTHKHHQHQRTCQHESTTHVGRQLYRVDNTWVAHDSNLEDNATDDVMTLHPRT